MSGLLKAYSWITRGLLGKYLGAKNESRSELLFDSLLGMLMVYSIIVGLLANHFWPPNFHWLTRCFDGLLGRFFGGQKGVGSKLSLVGLLVNSSSSSMKSWRGRHGSGV